MDKRSPSGEEKPPGKPHSKQKVLTVAFSHTGGMRGE